MAIFTFSTKDKKPEDEKLVLEIKKYCERKNKNFSGLVVELLREFKEVKLNDE